MTHQPEDALETCSVKRMGCNAAGDLVLRVVNPLLLLVLPVAVAQFTQRAAR